MERVRCAIGIIADAAERGEMPPLAALYCQGNAWLALREYRKARETYLAALQRFDDPRFANVAAQCFKNLGSACEALGSNDEAVKFFELALKCDPDLAEAHLALAIRYCRNGKDPQAALDHLDAVTVRSGSVFPMPTVQGWRIEILFELGDINGAYREIQALQGVANQHHWIWPWCASQVASFGRVSVESTQKALFFWRAYLSAHPEDRHAERERLFCISHLHMQGVATETDFEEFKSSAQALVDRGDPEAALLLDRIGHWAQEDGDWTTAEEFFRKAYELDAARFGYCLGTALIFVGRYADALPILLVQAIEYQRDAMSWFQVAVARAGTGDIRGSIAGYQRAIELDPDYELAWFNLGGMYWNLGDFPQANATWRQAVRRFPNHDLASKIRREFFALFRDEDC